MTTPEPDEFIEEVRRLKRDAAARTPTVEQLARRLREIEKAHKGKVVPPPKDARTDAA
jgi:hypothetical protein